jgi:hypothetical protein
MDTFMSASKSFHPKIKTPETPMHLQVNKYETSGFLNKNKVLDDYTFS